MPIHGTIERFFYEKSERMNQMLRFINQKQHFTLLDLMQEFQISKRTALRDIASLEEIGAPIYAEYGRYGGYRLLQQMQLPPISFNTSELHALYFAMQALRSFTNLPFEISFRSIHEKFLSALSEDQRKDIEQIQHRVSFRHTEQIRDSEHLEFLLMAAVQNIVIQITYQNIRSSGSNPHNNPNPDKPKRSIRTIQPIALYAMKGYWYCQAYDLGKQAYRVFRCDRITSCEATDIEPIMHINELNLQDAHSLWKPSEDAIPFKCLINEAGMELFQQEPFPSMRLIHESENEPGQTILAGCYEPLNLSSSFAILQALVSPLRSWNPIH